MIKDLFAFPIYIAEDIISEEENQKLIEESYRLKEITPDGSACFDCRLYSTFSQGSLTLEPAFDNLHKVFTTHIEKFKEEAGCEIPVSAGNSWLNIVGIGDYQEQHIHQSYYFSSVYYMKIPKGSAPTRFKAPFESQMGELFGKTPYLSFDDVQPIERSLVIFPSYLPHYVPSGSNLEDRITIATNWD